MLHLSTTFSSYLLHTFKHLVVLVYSTSQAHVSLFKCKKWLNEPMKHASVCFPDSHLAHPSINGAFKQQKPNIKLAGYQVQFRLYRSDTRLFCRRLWSAFNTTSTEICLLQLHYLTTTNLTLKKIKIGGTAATTSPHQHTGWDKKTEH